MDEMTDAQFLDPMAQPIDQPVMDPGFGPQGVEAEKTGDTDIVGMPLEVLIDQEIIGMITGRKEASRQWRDPYRMEWDEATDHYEQVYDATGKEDWQATTFQPLIPTHVERATASLHNMSMGPETPVEFKCRSSEYERQVEGINEVVQHDLEKMKFKVHWTDFLRTDALYGTAIGKIGYDREEAEVMVKERRKALFGGLFMGLQEMFGIGQSAAPVQEEFVPKKMLVKDWSTFKSCDIYKIYPQPHIEDFTKDTWVIEEFEITNKELVEGAQNQDEYYRFQNVTDALLTSGQPSPTVDDQTQQKRAAMLDHDVPLPFVQPDLKHKGLEYWGPVPRWYLEPELREDPIRKYETINAWIWVIDGQWVVRKRVTPHRDGCPPYVKGNYIRRPGQFYGIGIGKLLAGLQIEKNETRNTRQDNINLILSKVVAVLKDKLGKEGYDRLISGPGAIWTFEGIDDIRKALMNIEFPDITQDSWRASAEIDREAQEATDVIKTTQTIGAGEDQAGNGTFRGQLLNQQQANERFMLYARILEIVSLSEAIRMIYGRIYQFKGYEQIDAILGTERAQDFELIPPEKLSDIASLISLGSLTTENKGVKLAQMRDQWTLLSQEPFFKKLEYARKMIRLSGVASDPDEVLWSDEEMGLFNKAKRAMIQSTGMPGGMPGMGGKPSGLGSPPSGPIAGDNPPPLDGTPRPSMEPRGPGASPIDGMGRPAA